MFEGDIGQRVGTSSWSSKDWKGVFYPQGLPSNRNIEFYSTVYDTVEIDSTFYGVPQPATVRNWHQLTPDGFMFAAKVPRVVTHDKVLVDAADDMWVFLESMMELKEKLGPLLFQFPHFARKVFDTPEPFLERLDEFLETLPKQLRYAVEVRNPTWLARPLQELCARHHVAVAWTEQVRMPKPRQWWGKLGGPSADFAYIRFLGDHRGIEKITRSWDRLVLDPQPQLLDWVPAIQALRDREVEVFSFFNNHFAGHAPATIELFRELWRSRGAPPDSARPIE